MFWFDVLYNTCTIYLYIVNLFVSFTVNVHNVLLTACEEGGRG